MLPPEEITSRLQSKEEPSLYPSGQDTSFQNATPMPFRFTSDALDTVNKRLETSQKVASPTYQTSASEVGKLGITETDLPMRWYGRKGEFTSGWVAPPSSRVNAGLSTSLDRSNFHVTQDQGWSGHLGLTDYNVANLKASTFVGKEPRNMNNM
jgi:hypothetical protein